MNILVRLRSAWLPLLLWCLLAYGWLALTSAVLSWARAPITLQYDMSVYHVVGREWLAHGVVPYRDLIDIKGPLTFVEYGLGALVTPFSLSGTTVIHSLAAGASLFFAWKCALLFMRNWAAVTLTIVVSTVLSTFYGNPSESVLAFQMAALYLLLRHARRGGEPPLPAFGALAGAAVAVKYNLAAFFLPMIAFALWRQARSRGLRHAARGLGRCAAGAACVLVPFAAYFAWHSALDDLWRYYLLAGFRYGAAPLSSAALLHPDAVFVGHFTPGYMRFDKMLPPAFFIVAGFAFQLGGLVALTLRRRAWLPHDRYAPAALWASWGLCLIAIFRGPYAYYHYFISFLPFAFLTVLVLVASCCARHSRREDTERASAARRFCRAGVPCVVLALLVVHMASLCRKQFALRHPDDEARIAAIHQMVSSHEGSVPTMLTLHPYVAVFHRFSPHRPANRNAFPQMTTKGRANWQSEAFFLLENAVPRYVLAATDSAGKPVREDESDHPAISDELVAKLERHYRLKKILPFSHVPAFRYVGIFERNAPCDE